MKTRDYLIEFNKVRMGSNVFEFVLNDAFFQSIEGSGIAHADIKVDMEMLRTETMYDLQFTFNGTITTNCDNCLDEMRLPIESDFHLIMKISETEDYSDDEIVYITKGLLEYDLSQYLYESVILSIPLRKVCAMADKSCNTEVTLRINNFDTENNRPEENNPLWDKLKGIFNNN